MACITPMTIRNKLTGEWNTFPCSKCPDCMARRISAWSFRLMQEERRSSSAWFVTLTYDTNHVPISPNRFMTLDKTDLQKFMKRLRKISTEKLVYYACGEYGGQFNRPHYHLILFNATPAAVISAWSLDGKPIGHCHFGSVSEASIGYVLKYMSKPPMNRKHARDDRAKEFSLMSKRIGENYMTNAAVRWHHADLLNRMYLTIEDGKKISMPRYYKDKMYNDVERARIAHHAQIEAIKRDAEFQDEMLRKYGPDWTRVKVESDLNAFYQMHKNSQNGRNKI